MSGIKRKMFMWGKKKKMYMWGIKVKLCMYVMYVHKKENIDDISIKV